ncbi:hypothetical protein TRL7639_04186 [Falsiruegeria litorea R37]|uniref:Uncharacterized protein n=1 Tax=Falsiruegeria litorea R37 TaxID=1200284 RepID=A0A1Y5TS80_9RHOB|nr:hypothetical protein [Falsiruegeria litorea]SLN70637.1 hypothetical protein TRL7639_04186 [Falsiruegeria litorea R37]
MPRRDVEPQREAAKSLKFLGVCAASWLALISPASSADVSDLPEHLQEKVERARQACGDFEDGTFHLEWGAVDRVDLDGDLTQDWVLNERGFSCSTAASLYCGTGGCMSHFLVEDVLHSLFNQGWGLADLGPNRVLLADVHGSQCDGINPTPCVTASIWDSDEKQWRTTAAEWE